MKYKGFCPWGIICRFCKLLVILHLKERQTDKWPGSVPIVRWREAGQCSLCYDYFAGWKAEESWFSSRRENWCRHPRSLLLNGQRVPFPKGCSGRDVNVTTHPHLMARFRKSGPKPPLFHVNSRRTYCKRSRCTKSWTSETVVPNHSRTSFSRPNWAAAFQNLHRRRNQIQFTRLCVLSKKEHKAEDT